MPDRAAAETALTRGGLLGAAAVAASALLPLPADAAPAVIAYGSRGQAARKLNARLAELTYLSHRHVVDRFTDATFHALVAFQKYEGLNPDGTASRRTLAVLGRADAPRPSTFAGRERVEVSLEHQLAFLVERGSVRRTVPVSAGRRGDATPRGSFAVYRRERRPRPLPFAVWLPWAAYFHRGIAFHGYPDVPAYPASHGCVRVPEPFAAELYAFAQVGRRVLVV